MALEEHDLVLKHGDPVFIPPGAYNNVELELIIALEDEIEEGSYPVSVYATESEGDAGNVEARTIGERLDNVQVSGASAFTCSLLDCYAIEIRYKTFIKCPISRVAVELDVAPICGNLELFESYGIGDNRDFQYLDAIGQTSKSFQMFTVYYCRTSNSWTMGNSIQKFGTTSTYAETDVCETGDPECEYQFCSTNPPPRPLCIGTPYIGDAYGSQLAIRPFNFGTSEPDVDTDLEAFPPAQCTNVSPYWACGIDGYGQFNFRVQEEGNGFFSVECMFLIFHDGFPNHEIYVNGLPRYTWDSYITGNDIFSLCPDWTICDDNDGDTFYNSGWFRVW